MGKTSKVILIVLGAIIVSIFVSITGFKKGREIAVKRNMPLLNIQYTPEEINKNLDPFKKIKVDLSVSDFTINPIDEKTASVNKFISHHSHNRFIARHSKGMNDIIHPLVNLCTNLPNITIKIPLYINHWGPFIPAS